MKLNFTKTLTLLFIITVSLSVYAEQKKVPQIEIKECQKAPIIDGKLDDNCWKHTNKIFLNYKFVGKANEKKDNYVLLTHDDQWMYVAFFVDQPKSQREDPVYKKHDELVQREDNVQVSFDPGGRDFYQFLVSKNNTRADFRMSDKKRRHREDWNIPWRSAVNLTEKNWTAELAIPLKLLCKRGNLKNTRMNFIIANFDVIRDEQYVKVAKVVNKYTWSPLEKSFVEADKFGHVKGLEKVKIQPIFLPLIKSAHVTEYYPKNNGYAYDVKLIIENLSQLDGDFNIEVSDDVIGGQKKQISRPFKLKKNKSIEYLITIPVTNLLPRNVVVFLKANDNTEKLQRVYPEHVENLSVFSAFLDRDYYTDENDAHIICDIRLPELERKKLFLKAFYKKKEVASINIGKSKTRLPIEIDDDEFENPGTYELEVSLVDEKNNLIATQQLALAKYPQNTSTEWKIDKENLRLLRNEKPFFPLGMWCYNLEEENFAEMEEIGCNTVLMGPACYYFKDGDPEKNTEYFLKLAEKYNLQAITQPENFAKSDEAGLVKGPINGIDLKKFNDVISRAKGAGYLKKAAFRSKGLPEIKGKVMRQFIENNYPLIDANVKASINMPNMMGIFIFDEPNIGLIRQDIAGKAYYNHLKTIDPYHPVFLNYSSHIPNTPDAISWCDVLGTDPYWIPEGKAEYYPRNMVNWVTKVVANTVYYADKYKKVPWSIPCLDYWSGCAKNKRALTPREQRCQTYLSIIWGTKGIVYWSYPTFSQAMINTIKQLFHEIRELTPALLAPKVNYKVTYDSSKELDPRKDKFTDIQLALKKFPDGDYIMICANTATYPVDATISIIGLDVSERVEAMFQEKGFDEGISIKKKFKPYEVRIYRFDDDELKDMPTKINVSTIPCPEETQKEAISKDFSTKNNLMPNSSFEECSYPNWPDYYFPLTWEIFPDTRIEKPNAIAAIDKNIAYHGKQSLRLNYTKGKPHIFWIFNNKEMKTGKYTFSIYLKSDKKDSEVELVAGRSRKTFKIGHDWKCVNLPFSYTANQQILFRIIAKTKNAKVWCDNLHLIKK